VRKLSAIVIAASVTLGVGATLPRGARADDEEDAEDEKDDTSARDTEPAPVLDDSTLRAKIAPLVQLSSFSMSNGVADLAYPLTDVVEQKAFDAAGFDKVEIRSIVGHAHTTTGMEIGAGSRGAGRSLHKLPLTGDVEVNVELWLPHGSPSSNVTFLLSEKVGVLWGQTIVKPKTMRPYGRTAPVADPALFKEERVCRARFVVTNNELVVTFQGSETHRHTFAKGELASMRFGIFARNVRLQLTDLSIKGKVDVAKLPKK
jgi:hypothetical protein